jgi:hypothetical protein
VEGGVRVVCRCGKTSVEFRQPVDIEALKNLANAALDRARLRVYPVPVLDDSGFTLSVEHELQRQASLPEADARRYAAAINGEADLARAMVRLLAELEELRRRIAVGPPPAPRHGSGTMPRVTMPTPAAEDDGDEKVG